FPMSELQDVFAVLMGSGLATLLRGSVSVDTGLAAAELVPVQVSVSNTEGQLFLMHEAADPAGGIAVTLRNATESPLRIAALPAWIQRGATLVEARLEGLDLSAPVDL